MKFMKQLSIVLLAASVVACGGGGGGGDSGGSTAAPSSSSSSGSGSSGGSTGGSTGGSNGGSTGGGTTTPPPVSQTVTLSWTAPSTREDGSALSLSQLSGYQIYYYRDNSQSNGSTVSVTGGSTQSRQITLTSTGTYYFAIAAVDSDGLVSNLSNYVSLAVN